MCTWQLLCCTHSGHCGHHGRQAAAPLLHPVRSLWAPWHAGSSSSAVPNDLELRGDGVRAAIITGPNMGGKSCLIRQAALTVIMAQVGCSRGLAGSWCNSAGERHGAWALGRMAGSWCNSAGERHGAWALERMAGSWVQLHRGGASVASLHTCELWLMDSECGSWDLHNHTIEFGTQCHSRKGSQNGSLKCAWSSRDGMD